MTGKIFPAALCFLIFFSILAFAHPPSDIQIAYDPKTHTLTAVIFHSVADPQSHYIKKVDIALNAKEIIENNFSRQDNPATQTVVCLVPDAKPKDVLSVEAYCSVSGKLEKQIRIQ